MRPRGAVRRVRMLLAGDTLVDANTGKALTPPLPTAIPATAVVYIDTSGAMVGNAAILALDQNYTLTVASPQIVFSNLPTSTATLPSGALWCDTTCGNVVKVVP